jgi:prepilin-type processing-associated H-X9-DG protein
VSFQLEQPKFNVKTRKPPEDPVNGVGGKSLDWLPSPVLYILMHEPPAKPDTGFYFHWHYSRGSPDIHLEELRSDTQRFISPILFADGHVTRHDFTKALKQDPVYPYEETPNWIWYKPKPDPPRIQPPRPGSK